MTGLLTLWLPILISAVLVFAASSIIHMVLGWHSNDYPKLPEEEKFIDVVRPLAIPPGDYMVPRVVSMKEMQSPEFKEKREKGPVMVLTVMPNGPGGMGKSLLLWFIYSLVVSFFAAYIASRALPSGANYMRVFQLVGAAAFVGYALALWQMTIWYSRSLRSTVLATVDGLIYALLTAGTFGWLWPR
jgi:hypothetical protein